MNWDKALKITKLSIYFLCMMFLLLGSICGGVVMGVLVYVLLAKNGGIPAFYGLAAGTSVYLGGVAGRAYVRPVLQRLLLPVPEKKSTPLQ